MPPGASRARGVGEEQQRADRVRREHVVERLGRRLLHGHQRRDAGGEHHEVDAAERGDGLVEDPRAVGGLPHVADDHGPPAGFGDRRLELVAGCGPRTPPTRASSDRLDADAAPDAGGRPDDQHPGTRQIRRHPLPPGAGRCWIMYTTFHRD